MLPTSFDELHSTLSAHQDLIYATIGVLLLSVGVHYASKVNRVNEGEPPLLPGALPVVGHALAFLSNNNKVYEAARDWSPNSHPVSLSLIGKRIYVVLNPKDVAAAWRNKGLDFDPIAKWGLNKMFATSKDGIEKFSTDPDGHGDMFHTVHTFWRDALAPGQALNSLTVKFLHYLEIDFRNMEKEVQQASKKEITVNLRAWCRDRMGIPSTNALVGPQLLQNEPKMLEYLSAWESGFFKLAMGLPKWMTGNTYPALENMIKAFMKWGLDEEQMMISFKIRGEMMIAREASEWDHASANFSIWQGSQANVNPTMFWLLYQILLHPKERAIIEKEIAPAFSPSLSDPNVETLSNLDVLLEKAPLLNAMYWETLRYTGAAVSTREVVEDSYVNGWKFEEGSMVMFPLRTNHQNPRIYGERIEEFVPDRFISDFENPDGAPKNGPTIKTMKPFGGGVSLCPGRHFAINESVAFIASALRKFDIQVVQGQKEARPLTDYPVLGVYPPNRDVLVTIRPRK